MEEHQKPPVEDAVKQRQQEAARQTAIQLAKASKSISRAVTFFLWMFLVCGGFFIYFVFFANQSPAPSNTSSAPIMVSAAQITSDYANNEVSADSKYKNQYLEISGTVQSISKDLFGNPYVVVTANAQTFNGVQCGFTQDQEGSLSVLNAGQPIVVEGVGNGYVLTSVMVKNCSIVQDSTSTSS